MGEDGGGEEGCRQGSECEEEGWMSEGGGNGWGKGEDEGWMGLSRKDDFHLSCLEHHYHYPLVY